MKINRADFILGGLIGLIITIVCALIGTSFFIISWAVISDSTISLFISAFLGGFSAGVFTYYFNSKSRLNELRHTKYFEHRNTMVQIEHELLGARINLSRNIESTKQVFEVKDDRYRFLTRLFKLEISPGLSLRLLDINFINKYSELYIIFQSINSDISYLQSMVEKIESKIDIDNPNPSRAIISLMDNYMTMVEHLHNQLITADKMSGELIAMCQVAMSEAPEVKLKEYIKKGGEIKYTVSKIEINKKLKSISEEENRPGTKTDPRPKFIALFFDLVKPQF